MKGDGSALWKVIIWLMSAVIIAVLALENQHPVSLQLFFWHLPHISLALIVFLSLLLGASIGAGGVYWNRLQTRRSKLERNPDRVNSLPPTEAASATDSESMPEQLSEDKERPSDAN